MQGEQGNFSLTLKKKPRYVDPDKCIGCGTCAEKCPAKTLDIFNAGLSQKKAISIPFAQAVPLKYFIDPQKCIYFKKGKCKACEKFCPTGAINFNDSEKEYTLQAGAIILAPGFEPFDPGKRDTYGYAKYYNVLTGLEFERILSATGPYNGHLVRPSDKKEPQKIAWIQCVGSRDIHNGAQPYCSEVCCTYAIKEALVAKEHSHNTLDTAIFYIDIRTQGKNFERYYRRAQKEGVRFIKSKISTISPADKTGTLLLHYLDNSSKLVKESFDLVVLSTGLCSPKEAPKLAEIFNLELNDYQFASTSSFDTVQTSRPGIYVCGSFQGPKDIPQSVTEASASAAEVERFLADCRFSQTLKKKIPPEIDVSNEPPQIGVFVCHCGTNIASIVDIPELLEYAKNLPGVIFAEDNLFTCSQDTQEKIIQVIKEKNLNRLVIAACTPRTHEAIFQETLTRAGLNKYLFEMANIRNQCSWVHSQDPDSATLKAKNLIHMAVNKVKLLEPLPEPKIDICRSVLIVGGGIAGLTAAINLANQGYQIYVLEKSHNLGGQALNIYQNWPGEDVQKYLTQLIETVNLNSKITVFLNSHLQSVDGFLGNFSSTIQTKDGYESIQYGAAILATGALEHKPDQYLYGQDPNVLTGLELDRKFIDQDPFFKDLKTVAFLQCVGSRNEQRPYCSKVCCTHSIKNAIKLKDLNPKLKIFIVYRDIRTYGFREDLYRQARSRGIIFIPHDAHKDVLVTKQGKLISLKFTNLVLNRETEIKTDLLVLATAIVPPEKNPVAELFKVPLNEDGFFQEAHPKLKPVESYVDGLFFAGLCHCPKPIDESIAQANAAASKVSSLLSQEKILSSGQVAAVDQKYCCSCGVCVTICPWSAPYFRQEEPFMGKAQINASLCKGCGLCAASCRSGAISLKGITGRQIYAMIEAI